MAEKPNIRKRNRYFYTGGDLFYVQKEENNMQEAVLKVQKLGAPPEGFESGGCPGDEGFPEEETLDL